MAGRCVAIALALVMAFTAPAAGHLTMVCTSTSPNAPGALTIWLGTYHPAPATPIASGEVYVQRGDGAVVSGTFDGGCTVDIAGTADVQTIREELVSSCGGFSNNVGQPLLPSGSIVTCYEADPTYDPIPVAQGVREGTGTDPVGVSSRRTINCNDQSFASAAPPDVTVQTFYGAVVTGVPAGRVRVWTDNLVNDLRASLKANTGTPCAMSRDLPYYFDVSVADGGADCLQDPPVLAFADTNTMQACRPSADRRIPSGYVCGVHCLVPSNRQKVGQLECDNGVWTDYECALNTLCETPGAAATNAAIPGGEQGGNIVGVYGDGCGGGSGDFVKAGRTCAYICDRDLPDNAAARSPGALLDPVTSPSVLTGRTSTIVCNRDGTWGPGTPYCGCEGPPCNAETNAPPDANIDFCQAFGLARDSAFCFERNQLTPWAWYLLLLFLLPACFCIIAATKARQSYGLTVVEPAEMAPAPAQEPPDPPAPTNIIQDEVHIAVSPVPKSPRPVLIPVTKSVSPAHSGGVGLDPISVGVYSPEVEVTSVPRRYPASVGYTMPPSFSQPLLQAQQPSPRGRAMSDSGVDDIMVSVGPARMTKGSPGL